MLLLFAGSILLLFISFGTGIFFQKILQGLFKQQVESDLTGIFLSGLVVSTVYFNFISFWLPVNYLSLIPLFIVSLCAVKIYTPFYRQCFQTINKYWQSTLLQRVFIACFLLLLSSYFVLPPFNPDSVGYHIESVLWYEKFKVIPGLANVHGRFSLNPAAFIIEAAYSFTGLTNQPVYVLNGTITCVFLLWLLSRVLNNFHLWKGSVYLLALLIFSRLLLANMSALSSDSLVTVFTLYTLLRIFELIEAGKLTAATAVIPCITALFAPVAKLSAYPLLLLLPLVFFLLRRNQKKSLFFLQLPAIGALIFIPWLIRNYIMSGYIIYPLYFFDFFNPDWKAPKELLLLDYDFIRYSPKFSWRNAEDFVHLKSLGFFQWFIPWMKEHIKTRSYIELSILLAALFSPLLWFSVGRQKIKSIMPLFILWTGVYAYTWLWLLTSPDYRFGTFFLCCCFIFPLLLKTYKDNALLKTPATIITIVLLGSVIYYELACIKLFNRYAVATTRSVKFKEWWFRPLVHVRYPIKKMKDFPYKVLQSGVKLYTADAAHPCMCADLPCMSWNYGEIEMRGKNLDDGFRNIRNDIKINFPFVK